MRKRLLKTAGLIKTVVYLPIRIILFGLKMRKHLLKALAPLLVGLILFGLGWSWETETTKTGYNGVEFYNAAFKALEVNDHREAIQLFMEAAAQTTDPKLRAKALYNAATLAWTSNSGKYGILVVLYKESLRNEPGFKEASFNLELLYFYKSQGDGANGNGKLPDGDFPGGKRRGRDGPKPGI